MWHTLVVGVLSINRASKWFPEKLKSEVVRPPIEQLWYRGEWPFGASRGKNTIFTKCAAVVGSRRMSRYGRQAVEEIVTRLCGGGYTIVSGLMYGVDQLAHKTALECGGRAIGVLGYGITSRNEEGAMQLADEIVAHGGIVMSEYEGDSVSQMWMFPQRNRIVVALSEIIVVVEAGIKSGSLGTAAIARKQGKQVYAVPGPIFSATSEGTNKIIAEGAATMLTLDQISEIAGVKGKRFDTKAILAKLNAGEREIYTLLRLDGPQSTNEVARGLNQTAREVLSILTQMEMEGWVNEERGVWKTL